MTSVRLASWDVSLARYSRMNRIYLWSASRFSSDISFRPVSSLAAVNMFFSCVSLWRLNAYWLLYFSNHIRTGDRKEHLWRCSNSRSVKHYKNIFSNLILTWYKIISRIKFKITYQYTKTREIYIYPPPTDRVKYFSRFFAGNQWPTLQIGICHTMYTQLARGPVQLHHLLATRRAHSWLPDC